MKYWSKRQKAYQVEVEIEYIFHLPPVSNPKEYADLAEVYDVLGENRPLYRPSMGGEDFALLLDQAPGVFLWLGGAIPRELNMYGIIRPTMPMRMPCPGAVVMAEMANACSNT